MPSRISRTTHRCVATVFAVAVCLFVAQFDAQSDARGRTAGADQEPTVLTPGAIVDRPMAAGEVHRFRVPVRQGQAIRLSIDQRGVDLRVTLDLPPAPTATADDASKHHFGRELKVWQAPASGTVDIAVIAKTVMPAGGSYHLAMTVLEPNETLTRAIAALDEGARLAADGTRPSAERAAQQLQQAVQDWTTIGDRELLAAALNRLGVVQGDQLLAPADGMATEAKALEIYDALGLDTESADILGMIGLDQFEGGQPEAALATHQRAYAHAAAIDPINRAIIENDIARASSDAGDLERAVTFAERAVATFHDAHATYEEFTALKGLALMYSRLRRFDTAQETITKALELGRASGTDDESIAALILTLGRIQLGAGDDDAALASYRRALELLSATSHDRPMAQLLLARLYNRRDEVHTARELLEGALATTPTQLRSVWAGVASELGVSLVQAGDAARALELQKKALEIVDAGQLRLGQITVLRDLAATYRAMGNVQEATATIDRAVTIADAMPGQPYTSILLRERASNARAAGDLAQARQHLDAALTIIDSDRGRLQTAALRSSFGGTSAAYYADAIGVAMAMHEQSPRAGHDARAFELFERSRARSLTDLLSEARVDIRAGVDPALLAEQRDLQVQLGRKDTTLRDMGTGAASAKRAPALEIEIEEIVRRLNVIDARIRTTSPHYAALSNPAPVSLQEAQRLLDDQTVLLAISLGPTTSWGWAITPARISSFPLPGARQIEAQAQRVYAGLTARQRHDSHIARVDRQLAVDAAALSDLVLGPIASSLQGEWRNYRLAIIATGPLEYIPFGALPAPRPTAGAAAATSTSTSASASASAATSASTSVSTSAAAAAAARPWLVDQHEIVQLPSASVLALLRDESTSRPAATTQVAVIADPVYAVDDPRVSTNAVSSTAAQARRSATATRRAAGTRKAAAASQTSQTSQTSPTAAGPRADASPRETLLRGVNTKAMSAQFERLIFSRKEAQAIARLAPPGSAIEALDFSANVQTIASPAVARARIVHVASHGIFNSARPELSGLVLSLVDRKGHPEDGVLRLYDVFNLRLAADLVVLSGCETGLGRQMKGEGLIGLTRAFMYAGAPRVVASRWQVDDVATAELMSRFYAGMFQKKLTPAAALHAAQQQMRAVPRWRSPYYWAAFTLLGDWR